MGPLRGSQLPERQLRYTVLQRFALFVLASLLPSGFLHLLQDLTTQVVVVRDQAAAIALQHTDLVTRRDGLHVSSRPGEYSADGVQSFLQAADLALAGPELLRLGVLPDLLLTDEADDVLGQALDEGRAGDVQVARVVQPLQGVAEGQQLAGVHGRAGPAPGRGLRHGPDPGLGP